VTEHASKMMADQQTAGGANTRPKGTIAFEDAALVQQCREGDMQAFGALVAKYQDRIFNMIYRMCGRRADAEELAQETFLKALERIGQFRGQSQFYTWLFRIGANLTISHRRRGGRVKFQSLSGPEEFEHSQADALTAAMARRRSPGPEAAAVSAETSRRVMKALEALDDDFRLVVVLCDIEEMDYAQIADVLGVPIGTVKSRLHRARCMLKERLADLILEK
jgi:RNA polymerase sigma-70 factor (ECF subfamily)